jgi:hypothetical protein
MSTSMRHRRTDQPSERTPSVPTPHVLTDTGPAHSLIVVEGVCAGVVTAFLATGSTVVTVTVAVASVASLAVARHRD